MAGQLSRNIVAKEKHSKTAKRGLHPLEWFNQIKPMDMRSTANSSLNVVLIRKDIQLHVRFVIAQWPFCRKNIKGAMNWFWLAALATQEMSSSIYMAMEAKFIGPLP